MSIRERIKALEKALKVNEVFALLDSDGIYWVDGEAYKEKDFQKKYQDRKVRIKRVGFKVGKV